MTTAISIENLPDYLRSRGLIGDESLHVERLSGGVSGTVLKAVSAKRRWVVKQALPRLDVAEEWLCDPARILTEHRAIGTVRPFVPDGSVPTIYHADADNHVLVMECAPEGSLNWRDELLAGRAEAWVASAAGAMLADIHGPASRRPAIAERFADRTFFEKLRVEPFHRKLMAVHPELAGELQAVVDRFDTRRTALVHGDYSPKNILIVPAGRRLILLDFEVAHWGDPAFDTGFCMGHLCLKAVRDPLRRALLLECAADFWRTYRAKTAGDPAAADEAGTIAQAVVLMLARVDGKSPAHYLTQTQRGHVRAWASQALRRPPATVDDLLDEIHDHPARPE